MKNWFNNLEFSLYISFIQHILACLIEAAIQIGDKYFS